MLTEKFLSELGSLKLLPFLPFPNASNRDVWDNISSSPKNEVIKKAEPYLSYSFPVIPATKFMDFSRTGNRNRFQAEYFKRRDALAMLTAAECAEGKGRFLDAIIDLVWCICEETTWCLPSAYIRHIKDYNDVLPEKEHIYSELFNAETSALLSCIYYLLKPQLDSISEMVCKRIKQEVQSRFLDLYLENDYWWMGFSSSKSNNWNPWINSNYLRALLILENNEAVIKKGLDKCIQCLDNFISYYHEDGGCDEGPGYWGAAGAALFECLEILHLISGGAFDVFDEPIIRNMGSYIYKVNISKNYYVNFADASPKPRLPVALTYRFGEKTGDHLLKGLASAILILDPVQDIYGHKTFRIIPFLIDYEKIARHKADFPYVKDAYFDGIQVMTSREKAGSDLGLFLAAKGGNNNESHNHNDIGHFVVFIDGSPLIIDPGVEAYTAKTFGPHRYEIWTMQSSYHNLPEVNGIQQKGGAEFAAHNLRYRVEGNNTFFSLDLTKAYPEEAGIKEWNRSFEFIWDNGQGHSNPEITITDRYDLEKPSENIVFNIMTPCLPEIKNNRILFFNAEILFDPILSEAGYEVIELQDNKLKKEFGNLIYRLRFKIKKISRNGLFRIIIRRA